MDIKNTVTPAIADWSEGFPSVFFPFFIFHVFPFFHFIMHGGTASDKDIARQRRCKPIRKVLPLENWTKWRPTKGAEHVPDKPTRCYETFARMLHPQLDRSRPGSTTTPPTKQVEDVHSLNKPQKTQTVGSCHSPTWCNGRRDKERKRRQHL